MSPVAPDARTPREGGPVCPGRAEYSQRLRTDSRRMAFINYSSREIQLKIVYYGAALCGKTTNLVTLHKQITHAQKGELVSLATDADRTLFFDFLSLNTKTLPGFTTRFQLYTVPGPGHLQHHPAAGAQGRRRHRLRGRFALGKDGGQRRVVCQSPGKPDRESPEPGPDSLRPAVQQAGHSRTPRRSITSNSPSTTAPTARSPSRRWRRPAPACWKR